jgi:CheY-like chemotaxis protein
VAGYVTKTALIVDDSKTARTVLSSKLKNYGISVETRESAAAAIDYLYENAPDAIFMDYEMPGMDGFQALKVIKSNPNTAVIPVMMYTSKSGGLAVSQARALGAVGVLPKQLESKDFEDILNSLHLMPEQESLVHGFKENGFVEVRRHRPDNVHLLPDRDRRPMISEGKVSLPFDDFQSNNSDLESFRRLFRRELGHAEERLQEGIDRHFDEMRGSLYELEISRDEQDSYRLRSLLLGGLGGAALLAVGAFIYLSWFGQEENAKSLAEQRDAGIQEALTLQNRQIEQLSQLVKSVSQQENLDANTQLPMKLIEWAANQGALFKYNEKPFSDERALWLTDFVAQLKEVGFRGTIELRANHGNYCLKKNEVEELREAPVDMDISECLFAVDFRSSNDWLNDQSVAFANYLSVETERSGGEIEIILFSNGFSEPLMPYPEVYEVKTAGEWNDIAAQNQHVQVSLYSN